MLAHPVMQVSIDTVRLTNGQFDFGATPRCRREGTAGSGVGELPRARGRTEQLRPHCGLWNDLRESGRQTDRGDCSGSVSVIEGETQEVDATRTSRGGKVLLDIGRSRQRS